MLARLALVLALLAPAARAQDLPDLSPEAEVSLLTMLPGDEVYALFGHTAFRIADPALGLDRTYNYGTFDFEQPFFVVRFARGLLDYQLSVAPFERTLAEYRYMERPIIEQRLDLSPEAKQRLFRFLETNYLPENRAYRYDFFFDNCSTRPRDALEAALGRRPDYNDYRAGSTATFRDLLQPYLDGAPLTDLGIDLGLGAPTDRVATHREAMFLPLELMRAYDAATLDGRPLVAATDTLFWIDGAGLPDDARVANKTGEISTVAHDTGLVYLPDREPYALAILTTWSPEHTDGRRDTLASISRIIYEQLNGKGD